MDAFEILVIALSVALAIFLTAAIVLTVVVIKLMQQVRIIVAKADDVMDNVESVSNFFRKTAGPVAITGLISNIVSAVTNAAKKRGK